MQMAVRKVTMADIAKLAEVSVTTVSHVLNETRFVADEPRRRVLAAVAETGYTPNSVARSIATSTTETIGLALPAMSKPAFTDLLVHIEAEVRSTRYSLLLIDTEDDPARELRVVQELHARRVDGVLIAPSKRRAPAMKFLAERGIPTVVIDRFVSKKFDQVGVENTESTATLVDHLVEVGHRRIAMISGFPGLSTTSERVSGFEKGLERHGLAADPQLMISGHGDEQHANDAVHRLLALPGPPTALITGNNLMTIGAMRALTELDLEVPRDVALAGFDDFPWADLFRPRLTTVAQPSSEIGQTAVQLLVQRIADPERPPRTLRLASRFMHRESCGCR
ncbi:LacI family DNA-binding transcriptional regulator [Streptomyces sp. GbtcB7]|uniref:LacI family DNA-binding transcriptional regulator n=1 Tax=Streptomyces sp. GbtcB7 TaxID=2824752 RepID=UPI0020C61DD6|nr:LacI family DNA-binding transcriptional regulator [Streptomyces sp. GbtcB7]